MVPQSIVPETFWTDSDKAVSAYARIAYLAARNRCDTQGVLPAKPRDLKAMAFIYDVEVDFERCERVARELVDAGMWVEFEADGRRWWWDPWYLLDNSGLSHLTLRYPTPDAGLVDRTLGPDAARWHEIFDRLSAKKKAPPKEPSAESSTIEQNSARPSTIEQDRADSLRAEDGRRKTEERRLRDDDRARAPEAPLEQVPNREPSVHAPDPVLEALQRWRPTLGATDLDAVATWRERWTDAEVIAAIEDCRRTGQRHLGAPFVTLERWAQRNASHGPPSSAAPPTPLPPLGQQLVAAGLSEKQARDALETVAEDVIRRQVEWLPQRVGLHSPAAFLVKALRDDPPGPPPPQEAPKPPDPDAAAKRDIAATQRLIAQKRADAEQAQQRAEQADALLQAATEEQRQAVHEEAERRCRAGPGGALWASRPVPAPMLLAMRQIVALEMLGDDPAQEAA